MTVRLSDLFPHAKSIDDFDLHNSVGVTITGKPLKGFGDYETSMAVDSDGRYVTLGTWNYRIPAERLEEALRLGAVRR